jgi:hypothetical protein
MPYQLSWYVPKRVICYRLYGVLTLDDVSRSSLDYLEMLDSSDAEVHTLADLTQLERFPPNLAEIGRTLQQKLAEIRGWVLVVQKANPMLQYAIAMGAQMMLKNARLRIEHELRPAIQFLLEQDSTLDANAFNSALNAE